MRRTLLVGLSVFAMLTLNVALANAASVRTGVIHAMKVNKPAHHKSGGGGVLLASHGGAIEQAPSVYIIYWGPQWASGFTTGGHTSTEAQSYVQGFFGNVGGSSSANSTTQLLPGRRRGHDQLCRYGKRRLRDQSEHAARRRVERHEPVPRDWARAASRVRP